MTRPLPFPGYSWQISQHEICFDEKPLIGLLATAALFENQSQVAQELNATLAKFNFVTNNVRDGVESPWRDYQQVLPELGLMVSNRVLKTITLTEVGRSLLAGGISYSDMMSLQLMRYQYPNGYKSTTYSQFVSSGVAIRPAVMLLRGLLALKRIGIDQLSADQILTSFLPNRNDSEWQISVSEIQRSIEARNVSTIVRRNINAWLRVLGETRFFEHNNGTLQLSNAVKSAPQYTTDLAEAMIKAPLWSPDGASNIPLNWFEYFGSFDTIDAGLEQFIENNEGGVDEIQSQIEHDNHSDAFAINLLGFEKFDLALNELPTATDELFQSYLDGRAKLQFAKQEHNKVVNELAGYYSSRGWTVMHDPNSIDLLVVSPQNETRIIEVKTTTKKTMGKQVRTGVGQLLEYRYRYAQLNPPPQSCDIILNRQIANDDWHRYFCAENSINLNSFGKNQFLHKDLI